jgi:hypothetical protein
VERQRPGAIQAPRIAMALALVGVIGILDFITGWEVSFSIF